MLKFNEYFIEDLTCSNLGIKKLRICGDFIFDKNEVIRTMRRTVKEFLASDKNVDYLVAYYYPTPEDMNNNTALCYLKLDGDIKNIDFSTPFRCARNDSKSAFIKSIWYKLLFEYKMKWLL